MKHLFLIVLITGTATAFCTSSCNKDELTPSINEHTINTAFDPLTIDLIASNWNKIVQGVYTCSFTNIIPSAYRNNRRAKVYLVKGDQKIQIDYPIHFMGGELSATTSTSDITINYRCYAELPFDHLHIVVEIS